MWGRRLFYGCWLCFGFRRRNVFRSCIYMLVVIKRGVLVHLERSGWTDAIKEGVCVCSQRAASVCAFSQRVLKGQFVKCMFPLTWSVIYPSRLPERYLLSLSYIMQLDGVKKYIWKAQQQCVFPEIMTLLIKTIHRPCWEQFYVGTVFLTCHKAKERVHQLTDKRNVPKKCKSSRPLLPPWW